ncbi:NAD(P)H-quinone oxidoreductase subunit T, chloroplastic [Senna tora]|uniref:NAD(P)H-quinone oxidoreductase subunit T, chloroplastic n=1 Tax=Senna tora TaxID=362788 RepID=A0A834X1K3_9FABA|nr:NAD(P)H-quinone oxidoreductase subunit T, chloroplastic [Senna tora]
MASTQVLWLLPNALLHNHQPTSRSLGRALSPTTTIGPNPSLRVRASQTSEDPSKRQRAPPGVDTRIHWNNEDEGWIGGANSSTKQQQPQNNDPKNLLGDKFADLLNDFSGSHYEFLGVSTEADLEEIKAAYRRLSKEYHPDTTSLPLKTASEKFMKLREVYNVLSNDERRKFYDWTLVQEAASRQSEKMKVKLEDPYVQDLKNWESVPDMVDRLGGRNMKLSDQATTALTVDIFIIIFAICCIIYKLFDFEAL